MDRTFVVQYQTLAEAADENQQLVEGVLADLATHDPGGLRYAVFRLSDGVSFIHIVQYDSDDDPLTRSQAFARFQSGVADRLREPPDRAEAALVGSYRFLDPTTPR